MSERHRIIWGREEGGGALSGVQGGREVQCKAEQHAYRSLSLLQKVCTVFCGMEGLFPLYDCTVLDRGGVVMFSKQLLLSLSSLVWLCAVCSIVMLLSIIMGSCLKCIILVLTYNFYKKQSCRVVILIHNINYLSRCMFLNEITYLCTCSQELF
jgi:hypothetical protein